MALPLLAGIALGSLAVVAFNNKREIKEKLTTCTSKAKDVAKTSLNKTKEFAKEIKDTAQEKLCTKKEKIEEVK